MTQVILSTLLTPQSAATKSVYQGGEARSSVGTELANEVDFSTENMPSGMSYKQ